MDRTTYRMWPQSTAESLQRKFDDTVRTTGQGTLVRELLRNDVGRLVGWFAFRLRPHGICEMLGIEAAEEWEVDVLARALEAADDLHASAVRGRLSHWLLENLPQRTIMLARSHFLY